jgi:hypothetical protein
MKITILLLIHFHLAYLTLGCKSSTKEHNEPTNTIPDKEQFLLCKLLDTIYLDYSEYHSNYYLNKYIPIIELKTGIESNAHKDQSGYWYNHDSTFFQDFNDWVIKAGCDSVTRKLLQNNGTKFVK